MGKKSKEKKSSRKQQGSSRRPRGCRTIDLGDDQPRQHRRQNEADYGHKGGDSGGSSDAQLVKSLAEQGLEVIPMSPDGNCLFRSLSDQLNGDYGSDHTTIRSQVCDFMEKNKEDFQVFMVFEDEDDDEQLEEDARDFEHYIEQMRCDGEWGGNLEIVAAARLYK